MLKNSINRILSVLIDKSLLFIAPVNQSGGVKGRVSSPIKTSSFLSACFCLFVLFPAIVLLPGCTALTGEDWAGARNGAEPGVVVDYNLENYVAIPVSGQAPITSLTREGVNVTVEWKDGSDNPLKAKSFTTGEVYKAVIVLRAKSGYVFDPDIDFDYQSNLVTIKTISPPAGSVNRAIEDEDAESIYVRVKEAEYPPAKTPEQSSDTVIDYNLQDYVPIPVTGWVPTTSIVNRLGVTGSVVWKDNTGSNIPALSIFEANKVYQAEITLKTIGVYKFDETIPFKYPEGSVLLQPDSTVLGVTERKVSVVYNPTGNAQPVTKYNLTPYIPAPVGGETPVPYVTVLSVDDNPASPSEYAGLLLWSPRHAVFQAGVEYTVTVFLYAGPARYFKSDNFYHVKGKYCLNHPTSLVYRSLNIGFPPAKKGENSPPETGGGKIHLEL